MIVCDRCKKNKARYHTYVGDKTHDLCSTCNHELEEMQKVFIEIEKEFLKNRTLHDFKTYWEDSYYGTFR